MTVPRLMGTPTKADTFVLVRALEGIDGSGQAAPQLATEGIDLAALRDQDGIAGNFTYDRLRLHVTKRGGTTVACDLTVHYFLAERETGMGPNVWRPGPTISLEEIGSTGILDVAANATHPHAYKYWPYLIDGLSRWDRIAFSIANVTGTEPVIDVDAQFSRGAAG